MIAEQVSLQAGSARWCTYNETFRTDGPSFATREEAEAFVAQRNLFRGGHYIIREDTGHITEGAGGDFHKRAGKVCWEDCVNVRRSMSLAELGTSNGDRLTLRPAAEAAFYRGGNIKFLTKTFGFIEGQQYRNLHFVGPPPECTVSDVYASDTVEFGYNFTNFELFPEEKHLIENHTSEDMQECYDYTVDSAPFNSTMLVGQLRDAPVGYDKLARMCSAIRKQIVHNPPLSSSE